MILKAQNLLKSYAGKAVVKDVSLNLKQGEIVGLLGPMVQVKLHLFI